MKEGRYSIMDRWLIFTLIILIPFQVGAQQEEAIARLMALPSRNIGKAEVSLCEFPSICLPMDFNQARFQAHAIGLIPDNPERVESVTLYYTSYHEAESFSQPELNRKRLQEFGRHYPKLLASQSVKWNFRAQTGAKDDETAKTYFHGFAVVLKEKKRVELKPSDEKKALVTMSKATITKDTVVGLDLRIKCRKKWSGYYLPISKSKRAQGIRYSKASIWGRKRERIEQCDTVVRDRIVHKTVIDTKHPIWNYRDSTVETILNRHPEWNKMLVACDVTGSMSPYYSSLIFWLKLYGPKRDISAFSFFNDGNSKPDSEKVPGKTGGILLSPGNNPDAAVQSLMRCVKLGNGGDLKENNIEALLEGLEKYPDSKDIVLISDGMVPVRDMVLLDKIKRPVKVIICSPNSRFHPHYMEIARRTGGSIHTIEDELDFGMMLNEGETLDFSSVRYIVSKGRLVPIKYF
jgi:hypothetical protein